MLGTFLFIMSYMENQIQRQMELADEHLDYLLEEYPEIKSCYEIPEKLWHFSGCPICKGDWNRIKITNKILFCDTCSKTIEEIEIELHKDYEAQKKEDEKNHISDSDVFECLF